MHSATKYLGGHADLLMGAAVTADPALAARLREHLDVDGAVPGPMDAFLALRGLRTLDVRLERAQASAGELARRLDAHPAVRRVRYPGLPGDPGHARAAAQMDGFGAMIAFETAGGAEAAEGVCERVRVIAHATSLGGVESLIERRARLGGRGGDGDAGGAACASASASSTSRTCGPTSSRRSRPCPSKRRTARMRGCGKGTPEPG